MAEWSPPASGTPCWLNLPARDVGRAKQFYTAAFNWAFMPHDAQSQQYPPDRIAFFHAPDKTRSPGGAISKVDNSGDEAALRKYATANHGTATMYLFVSDLGEYLKKVEQAGGKKMSEVEAEGEHGLMQHFEDTEGNYLGMYMQKPKMEAE